MPLYVRSDVKSETTEIWGDWLDQGDQGLSQRQRNVSFRRLKPVIGLHRVLIPLNPPHFLAFSSANAIRQNWLSPRRLYASTTATAPPTRCWPSCCKCVRQRSRPISVPAGSNLSRPCPALRPARSSVLSCINNFPRQFEGKPSWPWCVPYVKRTSRRRHVFGALFSSTHFY